jgi:hypothetical protein
VQQRRGRRRTRESIKQRQNRYSFSLNQEVAENEEKDEKKAKQEGEYQTTSKPIFAFTESRSSGEGLEAGEGGGRIRHRQNV